MGARWGLGDWSGARRWGLRRASWLALALLAMPAWFGLGSCQDKTVVPINEGGAGGSSALGGSGAGGNGATGGTGGQGGFEVPAAWTAACDAYASAWCAAVFTCSEPIFSSFVGSEERCIEQSAEQCVSIYWPGNRAADMAACAAAIPKPPDGGTEECHTLERMIWVWEGAPPALTNPEWPAECFFTGSSPDGSACVLSTECQSGFCNYPNDDTYCGICTQPLALYDPCTWNCGRGLYCLDSHCVPQREAGESCDGQEERCHVDLQCVDGFCELTPGVPDPCTPALGCWPYASAGCALDAGGAGGGGAPGAGGAGGGGQYTCQMASAEQAVGDPCGEMPDGPFKWCTYPGICHAEPGTITGKCIAPQAEGKPCHESQDYLFYWSDCGDGLECVPYPDAGVGGGPTGTCEPYAQEPCR